MKETDQFQDSDLIEQDLQENQLIQFNRHFKSRRGARTNKQNSETQTMYKEALMDSIFGRFQQASKKLKMLITLAPDNPQPYHLLGNMHQQLGQLDKAAEYLFMSTYLSPPNLQKWLKVGQLSYELKMYSQAAYCFGRALKISSGEPKIMLRRAQAFQLAGQSKKAINTYKKLIQIAASPQHIKKYAKLRFRRGQYSQCREILRQLPTFIQDPHLVFMACESFLKQNNYLQTIKLLQEHLEKRQAQMTQNQQLPTQFLVVLFICSVTLKKQCYGFGADVLIQQIKQCYQQEYGQLYSEAMLHISKFNQEYSIKLILFLLKFSKHQTVGNYIRSTDYLCKQKNNLCLSLIQEGLKKYPKSSELLAQQTYIHKFFGIQKKKQQKDQIFYSDDDDYEPEVNHKNTQNQTQSPQIINKIIQNITQSIKIIIQQIQKGKKPTSSQYQTILQSLDVYIGLIPSQKHEVKQKQGVYLRKINRKKVQHENKYNIIYKNIGLTLQFFQKLVQYLYHLLIIKQWKKIAHIGQVVSKIHVFKNQNKRKQFLQLKLQIYEISVLGCLAIKKYNAALFFLRYLSTKHPQQSVYILALHTLMRNCTNKTFLSSALSKRLENVNGQHIGKLLYIQYMETGCFQLAINSLLKASQKDYLLNTTAKLCLSVNLLQISSNRNTFNKLDYVNRSAICLKNYQNSCEKIQQIYYNKGRWYAQIKINHKAIQYFQLVLSCQCNKSLKQRAAYNLIILYKQCDNYIKANQLSKLYFSLPTQ